MKTSTMDKRVKERYIEKVREKVAEWRGMHEIGVKDYNGNCEKLNLDQAANQIGISRKTLDDYYLQLRRAEQLGFDFEKNKNEKMGHLRKFVKEETDRLNRQGNITQNTNLDSNNNGNQNKFLSISQIGDESDYDGDISPMAEASSTRGNHH